MSDLLLPANAKYLKLMHKFPNNLLNKMNESWESPFIAHNILQDENWDLKFIDTDYRPLDMFHPLNKVWNWITQKALKDINK